MKDGLIRDVYYRLLEIRFEVCCCMYRCGAKFGVPLVTQQGVEPG